MFWHSCYRPGIQGWIEEGGGGQASVLYITLKISTSNLSILHNYVVLSPLRLNLSLLTLLYHSFWLPLWLRL